jgi:hypothetical protein
MADGRYAECHLCQVSLMLSVANNAYFADVFILNVVMLSVILLSVVMLSVVMLNVVVPLALHGKNRLHYFTLKKLTMPNTLAY